MTSIALAPRIAPHIARASQSPDGTAQDAGLRLTRRGRVLVTLLFVIALLVGGMAIAARVSATGASGAPVSTTQVTVGEGDTLWEIAGSYAEPGQTKDMIRRIKELNALDSSTLQVGQVLAVPAG